MICLALKSHYDHIVVGAGSAGCLLASQLGHAGKKILLLESGSDHRHNPIWKIPLLSVIYGVLITKKYNWRPNGVTELYAQPDPGLNFRRIYQPRGKVLGGSGTINGMIWVRTESIQKIMTSGLT